MSREWSLTTPTLRTQRMSAKRSNSPLVTTSLPVSRPMQKQSDDQHRRRLDDLRPFVYTDGSCCGPAKMSPGTEPAAAAVVSKGEVDPSGFTVYPGDWCTGGTSKPSTLCHHAPPIGGIQACPDATTCESRCKDNKKCLAFAWQSFAWHGWHAWQVPPLALFRDGSGARAETGRRVWQSLCHQATSTTTVAATVARATCARADCVSGAWGSDREFRGVQPRGVPQRVRLQLRRF